MRQAFRSFHIQRCRPQISNARSILLMMFSLPFIGVGVGGPYFRDSFGERPPAAFFLMFLVAGGLLFLGAVWQMAVVQPRYRAYVREHSWHPCFADYYWDIRGAKEETGLKIKQRLAIGVLFLGFLGAFAHIWFSPSETGTDHASGEIFPIVVISLLAAFGAGILLSGIWLVFVHLWCGMGSLLFEEFPYSLGGPFRGRLRLPRRLGRARRLLLTLQCLQEQKTDTSEEQHTEVMYEQSQVLPLGEDSGYGQPLGVEFGIPDNPAWATKLNADLQTFWELEVKVEGTVYRQRFLLPIYAPQPARPR